MREFGRRSLVGKNPLRARRRRVIRLGILVLAGIGVLLTWSFRERLRSGIAQAALLTNDAPPPEVVEEIILHATNPQEALLEAWQSGKVVHREVAIRCLTQVIPDSQPLPAVFDLLLLTAALDPDMNVRETALGILRRRNHPRLPALIVAQLHDVDQQVRSLGLNQLKFLDRESGVPKAMAMLDDPEPAIVAMSLKLLENWSDEKFGVKLSETTSFENAQTGLKEYPAGSYEKTRAGVERARIWWARHQSEFPSGPPPIFKDVQTNVMIISAGEFRLRDLAGKSVSLSDFRGKAVLINFWTTWCPACVSEMPALVALEQKYHGQLVILGISMDYVPDEHGHLNGPAAVEEQQQDTTAQHHDEASAVALKRIHDQVVRTVTARKINYPVLLDEQNEVGGRYNGGELPTTLIVDAQGKIRRRFVGARSLPVFEAMLAEVGVNTANSVSSLPPVHE